MGVVTGLLLPLGLTIGIEFVIVWAVQHRDVRAVLIAVLLVNAFTEPVANVAYQHGVAPWLVIELVVVIVEGALSRVLLPVTWARAYLLSLLANTASALIGVALFGI